MTKRPDYFWRNQARPEVARVIAANPNADQIALRVQLRGAYCHFAQTPDAWRGWQAEVEEQLAARRGDRGGPAATAGNLFGGE
jgi:hypothetical protein